MEIIYLEEVESTHTYLKEMIKEKGFTNPLCVFSDYQTNGMGSRGNSWQGIRGNLFFSFVLAKDFLPKDLEIQSASIYFSFILKMILEEQGSKLWLKWPNDFYIDDRKIGGTITNATKELVYCGIGLNLIDVEKEFGKLDINIDMKATLERYFEKLKIEQSWKQIFSQYKIEFQRSKKFKATLKNEKVSLAKARLNSDGSIEIDNTRIFSLR